MRIAIVGTGVSGLVAAHALARAHDVTVFERSDTPGGHVHTVTVEESGRPLALDTGFIVFNEANYPLFTRLLTSLGVASQPSEMSFGVQCPTCRLEYSSRGLPGLTAKWSQLTRPDFYRLLRDILRFNGWAQRRLDRTDAETETLGDLEQSGRFSSAFVRHYLVPMTAAIWSSTIADVADMPVSFLLRFYQNHGLLQTRNHPQWRTIAGGSQRYVEALIRPFADRIRLRTPVLAVRRRPQGVELRTASGWEAADRVVLATHADQTRRLLDDPHPDEVAALSAIPYRRNEAVLHTDDRLLPRAAAARASWNYHVTDCRVTDAPLQMTYYLNRLQRLECTTPFCVTLNDAGAVRSDRVIARITYDHPVYTVEGLTARRTLAALSGHRHTAFCGAYLGNGFHEDGVRSGFEAARVVTAAQQAA